MQEGQDNHCGNNGNGERHNHRPEYVAVLCAVYFRRFNERIGNSPHIRNCNHNGKRQVKRNVWDDNTQTRINQTEFCFQLEQRNNNRMNADH